MFKGTAAETPSSQCWDRQLFDQKSAQKKKCKNSAGWSATLNQSYSPTPTHTHTLFFPPLQIIFYIQVCIAVLGWRHWSMRNFSGTTLPGLLPSVHLWVSSEFFIHLESLNKACYVIVITTDYRISDDNLAPLPRLRLGQVYLPNHVQQNPTHIYSKGSPILFNGAYSPVYMLRIPALAAQLFFPIYQQELFCPMPNEGCSHDLAYLQGAYMVRGMHGFANNSPCKQQPSTWKRSMEHSDITSHVSFTSQ